jgi:uncharacterized damage-inducible protein DinB
MSFGKQLLTADVAYSAWANQRLLKACASLTAEELERDLRISHRNVLSTLQHYCDGERVWLDCLRTTPDRGRWVLPQGAAPAPPFDILRKIWPELWAGYREWLEGTSEAELRGEITVGLPNNTDAQFPRWKILRHVLEHSTLHRGQIVGMIRMLGHTPPGIHRMDHYLTDDLDLG